MSSSRAAANTGHAAGGDAAASSGHAAAASTSPGTAAASRPVQDEKLILAANYFARRRCIQGGVVTRFEIVHNSRYLGIYFDVPWGPFVVNSHITLINGALHEPSEGELDRLREKIGRVFREDLFFAESAMLPILESEGPVARHLGP